MAPRVLCPTQVFDLQAHLQRAAESLARINSHSNLQQQGPGAAAKPSSTPTKAPAAASSTSAPQRALSNGTVVAQAKAQWRALKAAAAAGGASVLALAKGGSAALSTKKPSSAVKQRVTPGGGGAGAGSSAAAAAAAARSDRGETGAGFSTWRQCMWTTRPRCCACTPLSLSFLSACSAGGTVLAPQLQAEIERVRAALVPVSACTVHSRCLRKGGDHHAAFLPPRTRPLKLAVACVCVLALRPPALLQASASSPSVRRGPGGADVALTAGAAGAGGQQLQELQESMRTIGRRQNRDVKQTMGVGQVRRAAQAAWTQRRWQRRLTPHAQR